MIDKSKKLAGFSVNPIGIGTFMMGGKYFEDKKGTIMDADYSYDDECIQAIKYSIDKGQNHIDTAQAYGAGHTEEIVGHAIKGYDRSKLFIASKVWKTHLKRNAVPHAVEDMLKRLNTDYLDMIYVHAPWDFIEMEEYINGLCDAVDAGLARSIGISNFNLDQIKKAQSLAKYPIAANQINYNFNYRDELPDDLRAHCIQNKIMIVAYRPLSFGALANDIEITKMAADKNITNSQAALHWLISQENVIAIPKAISKQHINENLQILNF